MNTEPEIRSDAGGHDQGLLTVLADGDLEGVERAGLEAHLGVCAPCRDIFAAVREARRAIRATATFPVPSQQAYFRLRYAVARRWRRRMIVGVLSVAGVVLVCAWLAVAGIWAFGA